MISLKAEIVKAERVQQGTLPPGEYAGTWSGYVIELPLQTETWRLHMKNGPRGSVSVTVKIDDAGNTEVIIA